MTMDAMVRYLENRGFKAEKRYDPCTKSYRFAIERDGRYLVKYFRWMNCDKPWLHQEEFLKNMVDEFEKAETKEKPLEKDLMTIEDMCNYLITQGIASTTYQRKNDCGENEVVFITTRRGRSLPRILNEYNIGGLAEIQRHRRYFLREIVDAFEYEERREEEHKAYISNDISFAKRVLKEKEKKEMNMVKWKIANIDITSRIDEAPDVEVKLKAYFNPYIGVASVDPIKLTEILDKKLNGTETPVASGRYPCTTKLPEIKKVIFNSPATIVIWADETKTIVKAQNNELFDPEKGLAMAITKKALGNEGNYFDTIKKYVTEYQGSTEEDQTMHSKQWVAYQRLQNAFHDKKATKADLLFAIEEAIGYLGEGLDK